jgi:hypothetical protein
MLNLSIKVRLTQIQGRWVVAPTDEAVLYEPLRPQQDIFDVPLNGSLQRTWLNPPTDLVLPKLLNVEAVYDAAVAWSWITTLSDGTVVTLRDAPAARMLASDEELVDSIGAAEIVPMNQTLTLRSHDLDADGTTVVITPRAQITMDIVGDDAQEMTLPWTLKELMSRVATFKQDMQTNLVDRLANDPTTPIEDHLFLMLRWDELEQSVQRFEVFPDRAVDEMDMYLHKRFFDGYNDAAIWQPPAVADTTVDGLAWVADADAVDGMHPAILQRAIADQAGWIQQSGATAPAADKTAFYLEPFRIPFVFDSSYMASGLAFDRTERKVFLDARQRGVVVPMMMKNRVNGPNKSMGVRRVWTTMARQRLPFYKPVDGSVERLATRHHVFYLYPRYASLQEEMARAHIAVIYQGRQRDISGMSAKEFNDLFLRVSRNQMTAADRAIWVNRAPTLKDLAATGRFDFPFCVFHLSSSAIHQGNVVYEASPQVSWYSVSNSSVAYWVFVEIGDHLYSASPFLTAVDDAARMSDVVRIDVAAYVPPKIADADNKWDNTATIDGMQSIPCIRGYRQVSKTANNIPVFQPIDPTIPFTWTQLNGVFSSDIFVYFNEHKTNMGVPSVVMAATWFGDRGKRVGGFQLVMGKERGITTWRNYAADQSYSVGLLPQYDRGLYRFIRLIKS